MSRKPVNGLPRRQVEPPPLDESSYLAAARSLLHFAWVELRKTPPSNVDYRLATSLAKMTQDGVYRIIRTHTGQTYRVLQHELRIMFKGADAERIEVISKFVQQVKKELGA